MFVADVAKLLAHDPAALAERDLVAIDGIDRAEADAQASVFTIFNGLRDRGGRLIVASRVPLATLALREDLRTRLGWGLVYEITPLADAHKKFTRSIHVRLVTDGAEEEKKLKNLQQILSQYPGPTPVYLEFLDKDNVRSQMLVDRSLFVQPNENLVASLSQALGEEAISLRM